MSHQQLYQQIANISADITVLISKDQFEQINDKLALRLSLLKELSEKVMQFDDDQEQETLRKFLLKCQQQDNQQVEILMHERTKVLADRQKHSKVKQAVTAYQQFSGN